MTVTEQPQAAGDRSKSPVRSPPDAFGTGRADPATLADGEAKPAAQEAGDKKKPDRPFWKRPILLTVMISVAVAAIVTGIFYFIHASHFESTDDAFVDGRISHIAPRVAGKVIDLKVQDNEIVTADQVLLVIDALPLEVKLKLAQAGEGQARAQFQQAQSNIEVGQASAQQAEADVIVADANSKNADQDFQRFMKLPTEARSQQQLDLATANHRSTIAQVTAAQKKFESMRAMVRAAEKTRDAASANIDASVAQVEQAKLELSYTQVTAGHAGRVTRRTVEVGNYVAVGQELLDVVATDVPNDIWITANFKETQLKYMQKGQPVMISIDSFPDDELHGHVDSIQNGTGAVFSLLPAENATGNYVKVVQWVPVKIVIDEQPRHLLSPGMSVEPQVDVREHNNQAAADSANANNSNTRR